MFVDIHCAQRHLRLQEAFGLPSLADPVASEVFGPYELDGETLFWCYDGERAAWDVLFPETPYDRIYVDREVEVHEALVDRFEQLRELPRPNFPSTPNVLHRGKSFVFSGWRFAWYWVPPLGRWEIAEHGPV